MRRMTRAVESKISAEMDRAVDDTRRDDPSGYNSTRIRDRGGRSLRRRAVIPVYLWTGRRGKGMTGIQPWRNVVAHMVQQAETRKWKRIASLSVGK